MFTIILTSMTLLQLIQYLIQVAVQGSHLPLSSYCISQITDQGSAKQELQ